MMNATARRLRELADQLDKESVQPSVPQGVDMLKAVNMLRGHASKGTLELEIDWHDGKPLEVAFRVRVNGSYSTLANEATLWATVNLAIAKLESERAGQEAEVAPEATVEAALPLVVPNVASLQPTL